MDNRHDAPGYILFATAEPEKFVAYLVWNASVDSPAPFCYAFMLTSAMDEDGVRQSIIAAQTKFVSDVERFKSISQKSVSIQGASSQVQEWFGGSLEMFGKTPAGKPKYRVIYSPTRFYMVGGRWHDREAGKIVRTLDEYRWIPRYGETDGWVLEKWLSAEQFAGSKDAWELAIDEETGLYPLGPYPTDGEWEACYTFPVHPPFSAVMQVIQMIEYGKRNFSLQDIKRAHEEAITGRKSERERVMGDIVHDGLPVAWGKGLNLTPGRDTFGHEPETAEEVKDSLGDAGEFKQHNVN